MCLWLVLCSAFLYPSGITDITEEEQTPSPAPTEVEPVQNPTAEENPVLDPDWAGQPGAVVLPIPESLASVPATVPGAGESGMPWQAVLPRLAILSFTGASGTDGENIALLLANDRDIQNTFTVIPRTSNISAIMQEQRFQRSGITDTDTIAAIGKQLNADFVVAGHIKKLGYRNLLIIHIVNVESFQEIAGGYREFDEIKDLRGILPELSRRMIEAVRGAPGVNAVPRLAVLPFSMPQGDLSPEDADVLAQLLAIEIANSGKYAVLPRTTTIEMALAEREIQQSGLTDITSVKAVGKATNAQYVLAGNIMRLGGEVNLFFAQILDIESAALRAGGDVEYRTITDGLLLIPELSFQLTGVRPVPHASVPDTMVWVEGGSFLMGSHLYDADEKPIHPVLVSSFYMGKSEVTQKEYEAVIGNNPSAVKGENLPVTKVSLYDAVEYCNKLSRKEGLTPAYSGSKDNILCNFNANGYRLPTEAEWEYAVKGGNKDSLTFEYAGGNSLDILGWFRENSEGKSHETAKKNPNSLGLYDMSGNVWEWCWDWYGAYGSASQTDPHGPASGEKRVIRGGSWDSEMEKLRCTYRHSGLPDDKYDDLGFRVVRSVF
jgi:formylglycine-generating enzyme required for sulfatase activity